MKEETTVQLTKSISFSKEEKELISKAFSQDTTARAYVKKGGFWHTYLNKESLSLLEVRREEMEAICHSLENITKLSNILIPLKNGEEKEIIRAEGLAANSLFLHLETFINRKEIADKPTFRLVTEKELEGNRNPAYQYLM